MDNKRNIIALIVVVGLSMLWLQVLYPWLAKKNNWATGPTPTTQPAVGAKAPASNGVTTTAATTPASTNPSGGTGWHAVSSASSTQPLTLGSTAYDPDEKNPKSPYPLGVTVTPKGAGITAVTLNRYREQFDQPTPYIFQKPYNIDSPWAQAMATRYVIVDGSAPIPLDSLDWKFNSPASGQNGAAASLTADVMNSADTVLRITKSYDLKPTSDVTAGYEVAVRYGLENLSIQSHTVRLGFNGPNAPKPENNRDVAEVMGGFDGGRTNVVVEHKGTTSIKLDQPLDVKGLKKDARLLWSGISSSYFDTIIRPTDAGGNPLPLATATAIPLAKDDKDPPIALSYETSDLAVPANGSTSFTLNSYFGPKLRSVLETKYYEAFPLGYEQTLVLRSGCYSACTWPLLINVLVWILQGFHFLLRDWGLAIIALVLLVRLLLHPITKSSQVSMSRMTKMGPEMERLKAKYGDDTEGLKKAQMEFYQEQGIAPFLGCLPMFLQMPIWVALWSALQSTFEIRHAPFLHFAGKNLTWIHDLSQPDNLIALKTPIDIFFLHITGLNLLPILMGVVFYINQKLQPQPMALKPEQQQQQKMMQWMSFIMFPLFLYSSPSGLNLYIFTSTLIGIFESKRIRAHIKEKEDREKAGLVIVDEPGDGKGARRGEPKKVKATPAFGGGLVGFFGKLQQMAEEARKEQERQQGKKGR